MQKQNDSIEARWKRSAKSEENYHREGYIRVDRALADLERLLRKAESLDEVREGIFGNKTVQG